MITTSAFSELTSTSPVFRPTRRVPNSAWNSFSFWFESAFSGVVYTARRPAHSAAMIAVSPTAVLPLPVGAETTTESPATTDAVARSWNGSRG